MIGDEHRRRLAEVRSFAHAHARKAGYGPGFGRMVSRAVWHCLLVPLGVALLAFVVVPPVVQAILDFTARVGQPLSPETAAAVVLYAPLATALPALLIGIAHVIAKGRA